jgi:hypothetical protein
MIREYREAKSAQEAGKVYNKGLDSALKEV